MEKITRTIQKEQSRQNILAVAYKEFSQKGLLETKTADIARSAGLSHGTIFVHFSTRNELVARVIEEFGRKIGKKFKELSEQKSGLREILESHLAILQEYESFYAQLVIAGPQLPKDVRNAVFVIQSGIAHYLEKALAHEKKSARDIPLHLILNSWLGTLHYYLMHQRFIFS